MSDYPPVEWPRPNTKGGPALHIDNLLALLQANGWYVSRTSAGWRLIGSEFSDPASYGVEPDDAQNSMWQVFRVEERAWAFGWHPRRRWIEKGLRTLSELDRQETPAAGDLLPPGYRYGGVNADIMTCLPGWGAAEFLCTHIAIHFGMSDGMQCVVTQPDGTLHPLWVSNKTARNGKALCARLRSRGVRVSLDRGATASLVRLFTYPDAMTLWPHPLNTPAIA